MALVNGGYLHCTDSKFFSKTDQKKMAMVLSKIQVSDPGPFWPSCLIHLPQNKAGMMIFLDIFITHVNICSARSSNRDNSRIVLSEVGIPT